MIGRDGYPAGVPCWIDISSPDPEALAAFYGGLFGWSFEDRMPAEAPGAYLVAQLGGLDVAAVGSASPDAPAHAAWLTYVAVDDADATADRVSQAGGTALTAPFDVLDAGRMGVFADPAGVVFAVWQAGNHQGAQVVNAPGTWNWSDLSTPDPEPALAFYPAVFGWEARTVDMGGTEAVMWCRPGYGDHLSATIDPGIRDRQSEAGAPAGFEDAVGWLLPADPGTPPQWAVTFAVSDTDQVADRAAEQGGRVIVPPYDAGPVRAATLADPDGAVFSVSTYEP